MKGWISPLFFVIMNNGLKLGQVVTDELFVTERSSKKIGCS